MNERQPLPTSATQPQEREASPVAASLRELNPKYERQRRYAKTEKGRRAQNEASKRWNDAHRATGVKRGSPEHAAKISESITDWWQRRKQPQVKE